MRDFANFLRLCVIVRVWLYCAVPYLRTLSEGLKGAWVGWEKNITGIIQQRKTCICREWFGIRSQAVISRCTFAQILGPPRTFFVDSNSPGKNLLFLHGPNLAQKPLCVVGTVFNYGLVALGSTKVKSVFPQMFSLTSSQKASRFLEREN